MKKIKLTIIVLITMLLSSCAVRDWEPTKQNSAHKFQKERSKALNSIYGRQ